jgi:hypothetical protein
MKEMQTDIPVQGPKTCKLALWSAGVIVVCLLSRIVRWPLPAWYVWAPASFTLGVIGIFRVRTSKGRLKGTHLAAGAIMISGLLIFWTTLGYVKYSQHFSKTALERLAEQVESVAVYGPEWAYSGEGLNTADKVSFDVELFKRILPKARYKYRYRIWMGSLLAVVKFSDGTEEKLALSFYGGFFKVLGKPGYLVFKGSDRTEWDSELRRILDTLRSSRTKAERKAN